MWPAGWRPRLAQRLVHSAKIGRALRQMHAEFASWLVTAIIARWQTDLTAAPTSDFGMARHSQINIATLRHVDNAWRRMRQSTSLAPSRIEMLTRLSSTGFLMKLLINSGFADHIFTRALMRQRRIHQCDG